MLITQIDKLDYTDKKICVIVFKISVIKFT